jgi:catecholate siderophore receptor
MTVARKPISEIARNHFAPAALGLACALPLAASAQAVPAESKDGKNETTLPEVKVQASGERADGPVEGYNARRSATFTKTDTPLREVPASVTVVPSQLMKDQAMQSLADVMRYVPGATTHQGEGNRDQFILRGVSTTADFYVDGIRDDAQVFRDLYNLERVEILKGTAGMIFGRGGAGGVVNRVTKKPVFGPIGEAALTIGSHSQFRGTADVGGTLGTSAAWRLNAMAESADSFRDGVDLKRYAINPTLTIVPGARTVVTFGYEHLRDERTADRGIPSRDGRPFDTDPSTFFGNAAQSEARSYVDSFSAVVEHDLGNAQLKNSFRASHYDKYYRNIYPDNAVASAVDAAGNMKLAAYDNANRRTNIFNQTDLTAKVMTGAFEHSLLAGVELGHQDSTSRRNTGFFGPNANQLLAVVPAADPFAIATDFRPSGSDANNNVKAEIAAAYVQDQMSLARDWKLVAGLRFDHFKTTFDDRRTTTTPTDLARTDNEVSPRVGLIWTPTAGSAYYASYSYSFLPSGEQLTLAPNTADLAPEKATNYEIGAHWDLLPKLTLSAAIFRLDRDDVRSPDPLNPGFFIKTGQQRTEGAEIGLQGEVTRSWKVYGGYAYLDGRITQTTSAAPSGARLQLVPRNMASLWNRFDFNPNWGAGLGVVYQGASFATLENRVELPAFTRADGAVYYTFTGGRTRIALNVENLFDRKYFPTADGNNNISPGAPRNLRLTVSTMF